MIRKLIVLNLKDIKLINFLLISIVSVIITLIKIKTVNIPIYNSISMINIEILAFGGIDLNFDITRNIMEFIEWLLPMLTIIFVVSLTNEEIKNRASLTIPQIKYKHKWIVGLNISILIIVLEYYFILLLSSLFTILIRRGVSSFYDTNQYYTLIYMFILNILTISSIIIFANNISMIFHGSKKIEVLSTFLCIIPVITSNISSLLDKLLLINQGVIIRHSLFTNGIPNFSLNFSLIYLFIFIIINVILGALIIKNVDISKI